MLINSDTNYTTCCDNPRSLEIKLRLLSEVYRGFPRGCVLRTVSCDFGLSKKQSTKTRLAEFRHAFLLCIENVVFKRHFDVWCIFLLVTISLFTGDMHTAIHWERKRRGKGPPVIQAHLLCISQTPNPRWGLRIVTEYGFRIVPLEYRPTFNWSNSSTYQKMHSGGSAPNKTKSWHCTMCMRIRRSSRTTCIEILEDFVTIVLGDEGQECLFLDCPQFNPIKPATVVWLHNALQTALGANTPNPWWYVELMFDALQLVNEACVSLGLLVPSPAPNVPLPVPNTQDCIIVRSECNARMHAREDDVLATVNLHGSVCKRTVVPVETLSRLARLRVLVNKLGAAEPIDDGYLQRLINANMTSNNKTAT